MRRPLLAGLVATLALALAGPVAPANAAGSCSLRIGTNQPVVAPYQEFVADLGADCTASGTQYASWEVIHSTTGWSEILIFDGNRRDYWEFYSFDELGTYTIRPSHAYDSSYRDVAQNTTTVTVKSQSALGFSAVRRGGLVTLTAGASFYHLGAHAYRPWPGARVTMQYRTGPTAPWRNIKTVTTNSRGTVTYAVAQQNRVEWRVVLQSSSRIWGRPSAARAA